MSIYGFATDVAASFTDLLGMVQSGRPTATDGALPAAVCWPADELMQAVAQLAQQCGLPIAADETIGFTAETLRFPTRQTGQTQTSQETLNRWMDLAAARLGLEVEPLQSSYAEVETYLANAAPAILQLPPRAGVEPQFVALVRGGARYLQLVARDGSLRSVRQSIVRDTLWSDEIARMGKGLTQVLQDASIATQRQRQVEQAILREILGTSTRHNGWLLRVSPRVQLWQQAKQAGLLGTIGRLFTAYVIQLLLTIISWWAIGQSALVGHFDLGWLFGWALLLITTIPFQAWMTLAQGELTIGLGAIFKQRLLFGVMQLDPEEVRHQGAGQFLGRVLASDTVEQLGLASGIIGLLAFFQLAVATGILALGIGGWFHALLLIIWICLTIGLGLFYLQRSHSWVDAYRTMTNDLVERMVGHRTRLAQEEQAQWHTDEDQILATYLTRQRRLDQVEALLKAVVPRGWMVIGVGGLIYALLFINPTPTQIAISLGGILFAYQALSMVVLGLKSVVSVRLAWREIHTIFHAATRAQPVQKSANFSLQQALSPPSAPMPLITLRDVMFRYQQHGRPVLHGCNLELYQGDRVLLEGPSGGGKSTLAAILAGLRTPQSGLLLLHNIDQQSMGLVAWREQVVAVPQFHENYILTGTLAFNLLMGRDWPPASQDMAAAEALCRELGLGDLIDRMPAGMQQMVGESGWQLSHGERSRIFIARALLQRADLLILDESFAALDPTNLERTLSCVLARAGTLLVIAHP